MVSSDGERAGWLDETGRLAMIRFSQPVIVSTQRSFTPMPQFQFTPRHYPTDPGCYLMKDAAGGVIYVGKAKNLRKRIASYFHKTRKRHYIRNMVRRIRDIEVILVNNETESLILENNLIKHYRPDTNRALMEDRSGYPYIVLTAEPLPRFIPYRKNRVNRELGRAGTETVERRFGPYINTRFRNVLLDFIIERYQIRTCNPLPKNVCLSYHLGLCSGVCEQKISSPEYRKAVEEAAAFLSHNHARMARQMRDQMEQLAQNLLFEKARKLRDQLAVVEKALESQIVERDVSQDQLVIWFGEAHALYMEIARGALRTLDLRALRPWQENPFPPRSPAKRKKSCPAREIAPAELITNNPALARRLVQQEAAANGTPPRVVVPSVGAEAQLLDLCRRNYAYRSERLKTKASGDSTAYRDAT